MIIRGFGLFALLGGLLSLLGWVLDVPPLTDWTGSGISIQPNTTVAVMSAGAALIVLTRRRRWVVFVLGIVVAVLGATALLQYLTDVHLGAFNTALMFERTWGRGGVIDPGRMGPPAALCWTLIGTAFVLVSGVVTRRTRRYAPYLPLVTLAIATLSITGHLYQASALYAGPRLTVIAFQTAVFITAISCGLIASVPQFGPMRLLRDDGTAGFIARRATPVIILLAFGLGWLRLEAQDAGWLGSAAGTAVRTVIEMVLLLGLFWWTLAAIRRHEAALLESRRRKDEFLAVLAHELRGPLAPLRNTLEIVKRLGGVPALQPARETMDRQLNHLVRLVDDLIDVSRITHNKIELRPEPVELAPIIRQVVEAAQPFAAAKHLQVDVRVPPEAIVVYADPVRLSQIFGNILNNACRYITPDGSIWVTAERRGHEAVVSIRDSGFGIPSDKLDYVFEMFTQVDTPFERPLGGLGIGLALVKRLVEMQGGKVSAHSAGPGTGSEFIVRLPVAAEQRQTPSPGSAPRAALALPGATHRILIVDDNVDSATTLAELLGASGHETHVAYDGVEAFQAAERLRPDVVLLDIGLPKIGGLEVCRRIREQPWGKSMILVALTGLGQTDDRRKSMAAGFDRHVVKPVDYEALLRLLAERRAVSA